MKTNFRRITAIALSIATLASATCLLNVFAKENDGVKNYPALYEVAEGTVPSGEIWSYYIKDYSENPNLSKSTGGFSAPVASFDANNGKTEFIWDSAAGAAHYTLSVTSENGTVLSQTDITETGLETPLLAGGKTYEAQITAYGADNNILAVSDVSRFNTKDGGEKNTFYSFDPDNTGLSAANTYIKSSKLVTDKETRKTGYIFQNSPSRRRIVFKSGADGSEITGAYAVFTSPEDAVYDFSSSFAVVDNKNVKDATVYFRIIKIDGSGKADIISPYDTDSSEWYSLSVSEQNLNPKTGIYAPQAELKTGEKAVFQAFAKVSDGSLLDITLGNPCAVPISGSKTTYKGTTKVYPFKNYVPHYVYDGTIGKNGLPKTCGRWAATAVCWRDDKAVYSDFEELNGYGMEAVSATNRDGSASNKIGYYWYPGQNKTPAIQSGLNGYGVAFNFTAPEAGYASLSAAVGANKNGAAYYRVLKNGEKLLPADGSWAEISEGQKIFSIDAGCDVQAGDVISLEIYSNADKAQLNSLSVPPTVSILNGNTSNAVGDKTFSPLWERPWGGREYNGEFAELSGSVWDFNIADVTKPASPTLSDANTYNSGDRLLYNSAKPDAGYVFADEQLKFKLADKNGMSLTFKAPSRGYYDFSTALNRLSGEGTVYARVLNGSAVVWPESGEWYSFSGESGKIPALELGLNAGDNLTLQVYAAKEGSEDIVLGLGAPVVQKLSNRVFTDSGSVTVYAPSDYTAFENKYSGAAVPLASRFNFSFIKPSGETVLINSSDSAAKRLSADSKNYIEFADGNPRLGVENGGTAVISFVSPIGGSAGINIEKTAAAGSAQIKIMRNLLTVTDWTADIAAVTETEVKKGETLSVEIKAEGDLNLLLESFNISVQGAHNNGNTEIDDAFYANYANPYGSDYYVGDYKEKDTGFWRFKFYNADGGKIVNADKYSSKDSNKLYSSRLDNIAYYFGSSNLTAELVGTDKGISLGFAAPRDDTFNFRSGFSITTADAQADIAIRMIKVSAETGETEVIWGDGKDWITKTGIKTGESIVIPYLEVTMAQGDTVYLQIYATASNKERLNINLVSPAAVKDAVSQYANSDISAKLYWAGAYTPYSFFSYDGNYLPMENRWNYEFFDVTDDLSSLSYVNPTYYKNTGSATELIWKRASSWPLTNVSKNGQNVVVAPAITSDDKTGVSHRFNSPVDGEVTVCAAPYAPKFPAEMPDAKAYYRVVKISAENGESETLWPADTGGWEVLDNAKSASEFENMTVVLAKGDQLLFQFYIDAPSEQFEAYKARANAEKANSGNQFRLNIAYTPVIVIPEYIDEGKRNFDVTAQWTADLQISPYWRYEYSEDSESPVWKTATKQSWGYWLCSTRNSIGVSNGARMWIGNDKGSLDDLETVSAAYTFTPRTNGFITMGSAAVASMYGNGSCNGRVRITVNGKNVWPASGWQLVSKDVKANPAKVTFEANAGDKVRFEFSSERHLESGESLHILWNPTFTFDKFANIYSETNDVFNMLEAQMLEHFKAMDSSAEFDQNPAAGKAISEKISLRKAKAMREALERNRNNDIAPDNNGEEPVISNNNSGGSGDWTEEIYTPGGRYKKIIRYITTSWWVYLIIGLACAAVLAAAVITIIILRKKGKLPIKRNKKILNGGK